MKIPIEINNAFDARVYILTDDAPQSAYGIPVLIGPDGRVYGPSDIAFSETFGRATANAIAGYAIDDHPGNDDVARLVDEFRSQWRGS